MSRGQIIEQNGSSDHMIVLLAVFSPVASSVRSLSLALPTKPFNLNFINSFFGIKAGQADSRRFK